MFFFQKLCTNYDCTKGRFIHIRKNVVRWVFIDNTYHNILDKKSSFFYKLFIKKKFQKLFMEKYCEIVLVWVLKLHGKIFITINFQQ